MRCCECIALPCPPLPRCEPPPDPQVDSYDVRVCESLGEILLVKIEKKKYWLQDDWFCRYISVKTPQGEYVEFPCFRWLVGDNEVVLRDGRGGDRRPVLLGQASPPCCSLVTVFFFQHVCLRTTRSAWSSSTGRGSWSCGGRPSGRSLSLHNDNDELLPADQSDLSVHRWKEWQPGFPMSIDADRHKDLPRDIQFDSEKGVDFVLNYTKA